MRKAVLALFLLFVAACSESPGTPTDIDLSLEAANLNALGDRVGAAGPRELGQVKRLPDNLKLTAAQEAAIKALVDQFNTSLAADRAAIAAILKQAEDARKAGKSRDEIRAIMATADPIRKRMNDAEGALGAAIQGVLTAEQKAWLAANPPTRDPRPTTCPALTAAQQTQINSLIAAFTTANQADLNAIEAAARQAAQARRNGASAADVKKILDAVEPARNRVVAARTALEAAIAAVMTAEQRACHRIRTG